MSLSVHRQRVLPPSIGTAIVGRTFFTANQRWSVTQWMPTFLAACCVECVLTLVLIAYLCQEVTKNFSGQMAGSTVLNCRSNDSVSQSPQQSVQRVATSKAGQYRGRRPPTFSSALRMRTSHPVETKPCAAFSSRRDDARLGGTPRPDSNRVAHDCTLSPALHGITSSCGVTFFDHSAEHARIREKKRILRLPP